MKKVFWPAIKRKRSLDLRTTKPAVRTSRASHWSGSEASTTSGRSQCRSISNGVENRNVPRILIHATIDSKKAFIRLAKPWKPEEWKDNGKAHFLDLRTLAWALFNRSFSLKRLCEELQTEHQKIDHEPTGEVTAEEIECTQNRTGGARLMPSML